MSPLLNWVRNSLMNRGPRLRYQAQENPPLLEHEEDNELLPPLEDDPAEENVENNTSVLSCPQDGHAALSLSLPLRHRYSNVWPHFLHLNS